MHTERKRRKKIKEEEGDTTVSSKIRRIRKR